MGDAQEVRDKPTCRWELPKGESHPSVWVMIVDRIWDARETSLFNGFLRSTLPPLSMIPSSMTEYRRCPRQNYNQIMVSQEPQRLYKGLRTCPVMLGSLIGKRLQSDSGVGGSP